ncbi:MAG: phage tail tube protein [Thermoleophilia bacterium]
MGIASGLGAQLGIADEAYTNEVQRISGTPSGAFTLTFEGATTAALATNATAAAVQAALEALPNIGTGGVSATGGALPTAIDITFSGPLVAGRNVAALVVQSDITGLTVATQTAGKGYGDYVAPDRWLEFVKEGLKLDAPRIQSQSLTTGIVDRSDRWRENRKGISGSLEFEVASKGFSKLLAHCMGKAPVITTPAGGTNTRDHTLTLGDGVNRSFTCQVGRPDATGSAGNVRPFSYVGCKVVEFEFSLAVDGLLMLTMNVDGMDEDLAQSLGTPSFASGFELLYYTGGLFQLAGANYDVRSFKLKGQAPLKTDRYFVRQSSRKKQPILAGKWEITGEIEADFDSLVPYQRFVNGTHAAIVLTAQGSQIESGFFNQLQLSAPVCRFDGDTPNVDGADVLTQKLSFRALWDGSQQPLTVVYRTTDTAA